jgi:hypothetical protein
LLVVAVAVQESTVVVVVELAVICRWLPHIFPPVLQR